MGRRLCDVQLRRSSLSEDGAKLDGQRSALDRLEGKLTAAIASKRRFRWRRFEAG